MHVRNLNARLALPVLLSLAIPWAALTQTEQTGQPAGKTPSSDEKKQAEAKRETPPDAKAYSDAGRITDPAKKIEALEKFKKDFPKSQSVDSANMAILTTLASKMPDQTARIRQQEDLVYKSSAKDARGRAAGSIADALLSGNVLLKDAESYAQKSVKSMKQEKYIKDLVAVARQRKREPPKQEDMVKRFRESRASRVATLGRVELALGNDKKGKQLLEEAHKELPDNAAVTGALGELAAKQGDTAAAINYLLTARLAGRTAPSTIAALESVYRKTHNGSLDGLGNVLDQEYRMRFPNPVKVEEYKPTAKRSNRVVLAEVFTGAGCPPCVGADVAFDAAMERYSRKDLAVVMYHVHVPRPDPMTNPDTQARFKAYEGTGVPTFAIDGRTTIGGGGRENAKEIYDGRRGFNQEIEKDLELPAEANLILTATLSGGVVKAAVAVDKVEGEAKDLKVQIMLVEKEVVYSGENGIRFHPMVVRAMGGANAQGFPLDPKSAASFNESFDLARVSAALKAHLDDYEAKGHRGEPFKFVEKKYQIDPAHLAVAAFVQDAKTRHVLQAAFVDLGSPAPRLVTENR